MNYSTKTHNELVQLCKQANITGYSKKSKQELIELITEKYDSPNSSAIINPTTEIKNDFVFQTMLTCIGNKRKLVKNISTIIDEIRQKLGKDKLNIVDGFAGSSVVSRELSYFANNLYTNDMELYSYLMAQCFLQTPTEEQEQRIIYHITIMNQLAETGPYKEGIICKNYAPKNTTDIQKGERCFYTRENALIIDTLRKYIKEKVESDIEVYCLVPLLTKASIHTNTAGVFKGFYKKNDIGCFGGAAENALSRIMCSIRLDIPLWNKQTNFKAHCSNKDINILVNELPSDIDIMYLDPPYNQHPYGSNYFMLNIIATNEEPEDISKVSGIPNNWNKSEYNKRTNAVRAMSELIENGLIKSKYLLISYNNEGIITMDDWAQIFEQYTVKKYEINYDTYKGSRNLGNRSNKVVEIMYLISRKN